VKPDSQLSPEPESRAVPEASEASTTDPVVLAQPSSSQIPPSDAQPVPQAASVPVAADAKPADAQYVYLNGTPLSTVLTSRWSPPVDVQTKSYDPDSK